MPGQGSDWLDGSMYKGRGAGDFPVGSEFLKED